MKNNKNYYKKTFITKTEYRTLLEKCTDTDAKKIIICNMKLREGVNYDEPKFENDYGAVVYDLMTEYTKKTIDVYVKTVQKPKKGEETEGESEEI